MRLPSSRRGVSEIIAALLIVCITVSAGTLFAAYASGVMGRLQSTVAQPYTEQLTLEYYNWLTVASGPTLTIRNDGAAPITFADYFIQGVKITPSNNNCPSQLSVQSSCTLTFPPTGLTVTSGIAYMVKFVGNDGTIFTFSCIAGSNTH